MKTNPLKLSLLSLAAICQFATAATPKPMPTPVPNLVANGNFETGNFNGWTYAPVLNAAAYPGTVITGSSFVVGTGNHILTVSNLFTGASVVSTFGGSSCPGGLTGTVASVTSTPDSVLMGGYSARLEATLPNFVIERNGFTSSENTIGSVISQSITTMPGSFYALAFTGSSTNDMLVNVTSSDGTLLWSDQPTGFVQSSFCIFEANSSSTTLSFSPNNDVAIVDNVKVQGMGYSHPGKYSVKIVTTGSFQGKNLSEKTTEAGIARIDSAGIIYYISSTGGIVSAPGSGETGVILNDGSISFHGVTAMAKLTSNIIQFSEMSSSTVSGIVSGTLNNMTDYTFTRTGN